MKKPERFALLAALSSDPSAAFGAASDATSRASGALSGALTGPELITGRASYAVRLLGPVAKAFTSGES